MQTVQSKTESHDILEDGVLATKICHSIGWKETSTAVITQEGLVRQHPEVHIYLWLLQLREHDFYCCVSLKVFMIAQLL